MGYRAVGCYIPNVSSTDPLNTWTAAEVAVIRQANMTPVPIIVPSPQLTGNPVQMANEALLVCKTFGIPRSEAVLYSGNHLQTLGGVTGSLWLPIPGQAPTTVGAASAIQYTQENIDGWSVDVSLAADDFPFATGLVVDFEYNTAGGVQGLTWYGSFQKQVAAMAPTPAPSPSPAPTPTQGSDVPSPCVFTTNFDKNEQVFYVDGNGQLCHQYWTAPNGPWSGVGLVSTGWLPNAQVTVATDSNGTIQVWALRANGVPGQAYWSGTDWVTEG